jgi:hypothetical protein
LRKSLAEIIDPEATAQTASQTDLKFDRRRARIVVIASINGGTGGGMVVDVINGAQRLLLDAGLPPEGVRAVLLHSTPRATEARDLAIANAYATLTELSAFYCHHNLSRGDESKSAAPELARCDVPFPEAYLADLGDGLDDDQFQLAVDRVAGYLYMDAATAGGSYLEAARRLDAERETETQYATLRSFGLTEMGGAWGPIGDALANTLAVKLIARWTDDQAPAPAKPTRRAVSSPRPTEPGESTSLPADPWTQQAEARLSEQGLLSTQLAERFTEWTTTWMPTDVEAFCRELACRWLDDGDVDGLAAQLDATLVDPKHLLAALTPLDAGEGDQHEAHLEIFTTAVEGVAMELAAKAAADVIAWLTAPRDERPPSLLDSERLADRVVGSLQETATTAKRVVRECSEEAERILHESAQRDETGGRLRRKKRKSAKKAQADVNDEVVRAYRYILVRLRQLVHLAVARAAGVVASRVKTTNQDFRDARRTLKRLAESFEERIDQSTLEVLLDDADEGESSIKAAAARGVLARLSELVDQLDQQCKTGYLDERKGLTAALRSDPAAVEALETIVAAQSRGLVLAALHGVDLAGVLADELQSSETRRRRLADSLEHDAPPLAKCGGVLRLLLSTPAGAPSDSIEALLAENTETPITKVPGESGRLAICHEVGHIPLPSIAMRIINNRRDYAEIAARLHTRVDVKWPSLFFSRG